MSTDNPIELVDVGKRVKTKIDEENYYMMIGDSSLTITCPHENRPYMKVERDKLDQLAETVTIARGGRID